MAVKKSKSNVRPWARIADALSMLYLHGFLTDAEKGKVRHRIVKALEKESGCKGKVPRRIGGNYGR